MSSPFHIEQWNGEWALLVKFGAGDHVLMQNQTERSARANLTIMETLWRARPIPMPADLYCPACGYGLTMMDGHKWKRDHVGELGNLNIFEMFVTATLQCPRCFNGFTITRTTRTAGELTATAMPSEWNTRRQQCFKLLFTHVPGETDDEFAQRMSNNFPEFPWYDLISRARRNKT